MLQIFVISKNNSIFANSLRIAFSSILMKKYFLIMAIMASVLFFGSCTSSKHIAYFQNIDTLNLSASRGLYDAKIMPKDMLTITVSTTDPEAAMPFNLIVSNTMQSNGQISSGQGSLQTYLVSNDGSINFPVVGKINVEGLTKDQCQEKIRKSILPFMAAKENPVVTVRMSSYRVTVMGEVEHPGVIPVSSEKMSILEALAQAGDLTIYARRDNVLLIREDQTGQKSQHRLNLNDAHLINSPYFYLQQNDVVYVQPNSTKAKNSSIGSVTSIWLSAIGIVTSVASLIVNILN